MEHWAAKRLRAGGDTEGGEVLERGDAVEAGTVCKGAGLRRRMKRHEAKAKARATAAWTPTAQALSFAVRFLSPADVGALAAAGREGRAAASCLAFARHPPHALNAEASLLVRRVDTIRAAYADVITAGGGFSVRCRHDRRVAYVGALITLAKALWGATALSPRLLPEAADQWIDAYWGVYLADRGDGTVEEPATLDVAAAVLADLEAKSAKPQPLAKVLEWATAWRFLERGADATTEALVKRGTAKLGKEKEKEAKEAKTIEVGAKRGRRASVVAKRLRRLVPLSAPYLRHWAVNTALVGGSDTRWPGAVWVHSKA